MIIHELHAIQEQHGYLPAEALQTLSRDINEPLYRLYGLASFYPHFRLEPPPAAQIRVCRDFSCHLRGATDLYDIVCTAADASPLDNVEVTPTSCLGQCDEAPAITINERPYTKMSAQRITALLETLASERTLRQQRLTPIDTAFQCDPYQGESRYEALRQFVAGGDAQAIIDALKQSGLRGMGGAGFPTGVKWELVRNTHSDVKYVICNADESEPGTSKDRFILQHLPDLLLEGMALAALLVGAQKAIVYIRHEYGREREQLQKLIRRRQNEGILGDGLFDSGHHVEFDIFESPGGYICGEETALLEALEDKRAEPRNKPPFPGTHGLYGKGRIF